MTASATGRRLRRASIASVAAMAIFGLSACGGDDSGSKATDSTGSGTTSSATTDAAAGSSSSDSSSQAASGSASKPAAGSEVSAADMGALFSAAFSKATSAHVTLNATGGQISGLTAEGDASYSDPLAMQMTMTLPQMGKADVKLVDNVMYMKLPMLGEKYIKFPLDDPSNPVGPMLTQQLDPSQMVKTLQGAITSATYVGNEDVNGEKLDHYTVQVDTQKMLQSYGSALPSSAAGTAGMPKTLAYDMWFDDQGLFRQMKFDLGSEGSFTGTFSNWGEKVSVEAPPASEVTDMPSMPSMGASS